MITPHLQEFLESGASILVGTRDDRLRAACVRAMGARVEPSGRELTLFVPAAVAGPTLANLRDNGRIAVCFSRPHDHHSVQLKGLVVTTAEASDADRAWIDRYREAFARETAWVGLPIAKSMRIAHWPSRAVRLRVERIFSQTPGPGAGEPLGGGTGG